MRQSFNASFIYTSNFIGLNLGADYCAEHEWGIDDIKKYLGVDSNAAFGLPRKLITKADHLKWYDDGKRVGFILYRFYSDEGNDWKPREVSIYSDKQKTIYTSWAKDGFYVLTDKNNKNAKVIERITKLFEAINNKNACIWLGGGGVFENAGLCIGIVDQMDKQIFDDWYAVDKDRHDTKVEFEKTGIEKLLKAAGKKWFALRPSGKGKNLKVWLNPYEQDKDNACWCTIEDLKLWAKNKGPVPKFTVR